MIVQSHVVSLFAGFGMTTPKTVAGRVVVILYGFLGCSGAILFFNLFLERIITFLAYLLRTLHELRLRSKGFVRPRPKGANPPQQPPPQRRDSQTSWDCNLDEWKPSVSGGGGRVSERASE